jgi:hypothetical protein
MNLLFSTLINHALTLAENLLIQNEPKIVEAVEAELKVFVLKFENLLSKKSPKVGAVLNPVLNQANTVVDRAINAAGHAAIGQ